MFQDEAERELFFEAAIRDARQQCETDPANVQALVHWGGALLELAHYKQGDEALMLINEAILRLKTALDHDPTKAEANWCLGNAYTSQGFLCSQRPEALKLFEQASSCFKKCSEKDPSNETYRKALAMTEKAPEYYDEIQTQLAASASGRGEDGGTQRKGKGASTNDFWWDAAGWVCLGVLLVAVVAISRTGPTAPPPKA